MASKAASRTLQSLSRQAPRRSCQCASSATSRNAPSVRQISASASRKEVEYETEPEERPRWSYTPKDMMAPFNPRLKDPTKAWECNSDPARLDQFYISFLGRGGDNVLTSEIKWLAITHKSFDQGRRGFNDRLAFLGRRILNLQTTLALLHSPVATQTQALPHASNDRVPFTHPALEGLANLSAVPLSEVLTKSRLARLASGMGMAEIIRWKPKNPQNLEGSGIEVVLTTTIYAIIGAIALQRGGDIAARVARERVLKPLGIS